MDRRNFLKLAVATPVVAYTPWALGAEEKQNFGWVPTTRRSRIPHFSHRAGQGVKGSGRGREVRLSEFVKRALGGKLLPHHQLIGDCVGQAYGLTTDTLAGTQIFLHGRAEKFTTKTSTEAIYAGSRYEIGYTVYGSASILRGDGSNGSWAAEFLRDYGTLPRGKYGKYDLSEYDSRLARQWGKSGVPDELEQIVREHPVRSYSQCRNYNECRDAIANGYPVVFCSGVGFNNCRRHNSNGRDSQGFLVPCGQWYHAMAALDVDDKSARKSITLYQSWGADWLNGAYTDVEGLEKWAFKVDAEVIDRMCSYGDTYAISNYLGHPGQSELDYDLF